jgi:hypothetical protein
MLPYVLVLLHHLQGTLILLSLKLYNIKIINIYNITQNSRSFCDKICAVVKLW